MKVLFSYLSPPEAVRDTSRFLQSPMFFTVLKVQRSYREQRYSISETTHYYYSGFETICQQKPIQLAENVI